MNNLINAVLLLFVIGIGFSYTIQEIVVDEPAPKAKVFYWDDCKNKVERPRQQTVWGESSTGYDCLD